MSDRIKEGVIKVVCETLKVDEADVTLESRFVDDLGADSLKSLELVAGFEEEFDIEMEEEAALSVKTVGDAVTFISKVVKEQHG
ncbi:MAG TPA: acyl carrier protein [Candidatus Brocadiia bacterium]|nr:acyl carrier protein [Candidatus Brocadiia bacterium]